MSLVQSRALVLHKESRQVQQKAHQRGLEGLAGADFAHMSCPTGASNADDCCQVRSSSKFGPLSLTDLSGTPLQASHAALRAPIHPPVPCSRRSCC
jgi:hypothetical protein